MPSMLKYGTVSQVFLQLVVACQLSIGTNCLGLVIQLEFQHFDVIS